MRRFTRAATRIAGIAALISLASCSSMPKMATNALTGGAGAFIGHELSGGEPEGALLGAAAGTVAGEVLSHSRETGQQRAFTAGYDKGRSDEVKRLYWVQKRLHQGDEFADSVGGSELSPSFYEIPVPEHVSSDGTIIEPHTEVIEVLEP